MSQYRHTSLCELDKVWAESHVKLSRLREQKGHVEDHLREINEEITSLTTTVNAVFNEIQRVNALPKTQPGEAFIIKKG